MFNDDGLGEAMQRSGDKERANRAVNSMIDINKQLIELIESIIDTDSLWYFDDKIKKIKKDIDNATQICKNT